MRAYRIEKTVSQNGKIELDAVPFAAGEKVEIIVLGRKKSDSAETEPFEQKLKGSVLNYIDPTQPVAEDEWAALQ